MASRQTPNIFKGPEHTKTHSNGLKSQSSVEQDGCRTVPGPPTNPLSSLSLSTTGKSLSDAHLLAASPRGTMLDQVAQVMLYRSRGDVNIPDIGRKCPRIVTLSLNKCGAMRMTDGKEVGGAWEELMELNLQVCTVYVIVIMLYSMYNK